MTKVLIDIDDDALEAAQQVYGTKTKKDTVNRALAEVSARVERAAAWRELQQLIVEEDALGAEESSRPGTADAA